MKLVASLLLGLVAISASQAGTLVETASWVEESVENGVIEVMPEDKELVVVRKEVITDEIVQRVPLEESPEESTIERDIAALLHEVSEEIQRMESDDGCQEKASKDATAAVSQALVHVANCIDQSYPDIKKIIKDAGAFFTDLKADFKLAEKVIDVCSHPSGYWCIYQGMLLCEKLPRLFSDAKTLFDDLFPFSNDLVSTKQSCLADSLKSVSRQIQSIGKEYDVCQGSADSNWN